MAELEALLERTAAALPVADADRLAQVVGERLRAGSVAGRPPAWRRPLLIVAGAAAVIALVVAVVPTTRHAVADFLGIGAVRVTPGVATGPAVGLDLGPAVSLDEARAAVDFAVAVPAAPGYDRPDHVHLRTTPSLQEVTLVYDPGPNRPASPVAPVGVLLSEIRAEPDYSYVKKLFGAGTQVEFVDVGSAQGFWISGDVHQLVVLTPDGSEQTAPVRLAANTLVWERGGVTFRLESALSRAQAIAIATSVR